MKLNRKYITPFITLIFFVVGFTGILMFFHLFDGYTEVLHECLGVFFVVFTIFHILVNWKALKIHFHKRLMIPAAVSVVILSVAFVINQQQHPKVDTIILNRIIKAPIQDAFKVLGVDNDHARIRLEAEGISITDAATIEAISIENDAAPGKVIDLIME